MSNRVSWIQRSHSEQIGQQPQLLCLNCNVIMQNSQNTGVYKLCLDLTLEQQYLLSQRKPQNGRTV
ncbi:unnamed protein product [Paramecium octaurelia]|uniref:Uncharacterized protein n=1 Tax=Paramecium octaurelia TaxID=43137 RepID=A0A8S1WWF9_PAROT|nr:unnamed protein product [Paramecium octaurelia]